MKKFSTPEEMKYGFYRRIYLKNHLQVPLPARFVKNPYTISGCNAWCKGKKEICSAVDVFQHPLKIGTDEALWCGYLGGQITPDDFVTENTDSVNSPNFSTFDMMLLSEERKKTYDNKVLNVSASGKYNTDNFDKCIALCENDKNCQAINFYHGIDTKAYKRPSVCEYIDMNTDIPKKLVPQKNTLSQIIRYKGFTKYD